MEIGFFDYGASDDPYTWVFRYNGDSLALLGGFTAAPDGESTVIQGDGTASNNIDIYFYFEDEQGTKHDACIRMEDGDLFKIILPDETTTSTEVFDGLAFAG